MTHQIRFFSEFPLDVLVHIYSKLPPQELLASRLHLLLGPLHQLAVDLALFSMSDAEAIGCQLELLRKWNMEALDFHNRFSPCLGELSRSLLLSMQNIESNPEHRFLGLMALGAIQKRTFLIEEDLVYKLSDKLNDDQYIVIAVQYLRQIIDGLDKARLNSLFLRFSGRLDERDWRVRQSALVFLFLIDRRLDKVQSAELLIQVKNKLTDRNERVCQTAFEFVCLNSNRLTEVDLAKTISLVIKILDARDWMLTDEMWGCFNSLINILNNSQIELFVSQSARKLNAHLWKIRSAALYFLTCISDRFNESQTEKFITQLIHKLDDPHWEVRLKALYCLMDITNRLNETYLTKVLPHVIKKLTDQNRDLGDAAKQCLVGIAQRLNETEYAALITYLTGNDYQVLDKSQPPLAWHVLIACPERLNGILFERVVVHILNTLKAPLWEPWRTFYLLISFAGTLSETQALTLLARFTKKIDTLRLWRDENSWRCLIAIISRLHETQFGLFVDKIHKKLDSRRIGVPQAALMALTRIADRINETALQSFITVVIRKLHNINPEVCQRALEFLKAIAGRLNETQIASLIPQVIENLRPQETFLVRWAAMAFLGAIVGSVNERELPLLITQLIDGLEHVDWEVQFEALVGLSAITDKLNETEFIKVINKWFSSNFIEYEGLEGVVMAIAELKNEKRFTMCLTLIFKTVNDSQKSEEGRAILLQYLSNLANRLNDTQFAELVTQVSEKLDNPSELVRDAAWECLINLVLRLDEEQIAVLIPGLFKKLDADPYKNPGNALRCLELIVDRLNEADAAVLSTILIGKLNDKRCDVRLKVLNLASRLMVLGKYRRGGGDMPNNPTVERLVLESLEQCYSQALSFAKKTSHSYARISVACP